MQRVLVEEFMLGSIAEEPAKKMSSVKVFGVHGSTFHGIHTAWRFLYQIVRAAASMITATSGMSIISRYFSHCTRVNAEASSTSSGSHDTIIGTAE